MKTNASKPNGTSTFNARGSMFNVLLTLLLLHAATSSALAATVRYVDVNNTNATPPYTNWVTAATNIQQAVDAAVAGDEIVVTNGTYATGERNGTRVAVEKELVLRSVNGPDVTVINGGGGVRCLYLTNGAVMVGFTLTNGVEGLWSSGAGVYCESTSAVLSNCVLTGNYGGGAYGGTLNDCIVTGNSSWGASFVTLNNCVVSGNAGRGATGCTLYNCTVTGNSGGGVSAGTLYNCIVYFNSDSNGGNYDPSSTLNYCCTTPLPTNGVGNLSADPQLASASHLSAESPCTGAGNATYACGTDIDGEAWANPPSIGCDEYHPRAVTGPLTVSLTATLTNVSIGFRVGLTGFIEGRTDLSVWVFDDGFVQVNEPYTSHTWTAPGDYLVTLWAFNDSHPAGVSATLTIHVEEGLHYVAATSASPVTPYTSWATAATNIQDAVDVSPPGATIFVTNGTYAAGGRDDNLVMVDKPLVLRSVNGPSVTVINGGGAVRCLYLTSDVVMVGFTLTNGSAHYGGGVYCESTSAVLSNCVLAGNSALPGYGGGACGGTLNHCTLSSNSATAVFILNGYFGGRGGGAVSCTLNHCTLTGNRAWYGGGTENCVLNNCTLTGNRACVAYRSGGCGGGAYGGTLNNCTLTSNSAEYGDYAGGAGGGACAGYWGACTLNNCTLTGNEATSGGGAEGCTLNNCTVVDNLAWDAGGGVASATLANCIVAYNAAWTDPNYTDSILDYCCTTPLPTGGRGNIALPPLFANYAGGNLRLQTNSPCINAGNNSHLTGDYFTNLFDLDGNPRTVSGTVDMGAYEFQGIGSRISYAWLQHYGLPTGGSADFLDPDHDGHNNWQEWCADTTPTNALSALRMVTVTNGTPGLRVTWQSVPTRSYWLDRATNLASPPSFSSIASNIAGQVGRTTYADTNAVGPGPFFYRVGVQDP